jgi:acyl-CoA synthetase (AMP-forming)/AMP-acid ligase II
MLDTLDSLTLGSVLDAATAEAPGTEALVIGDRRLTYEELRHDVRAHARSLMALGVEPGDAVAILMPNCVDNVLAILAITMIGGVCIPINSRFRPRELAYVIADGDARVVLTSDLVEEHVDYAARLREALPELAGCAAGVTPRVAGAPLLRHVVLLGRRPGAGMMDRSAFEALPGAVDDEELDARTRGVGAEQTAIMLYTSGTTANPKGCPLKHRQLTAVSRQLQLGFGARAGDRVWDPLPLFHASAILPLLICLHARATFFSTVHFDARAALEDLEGEEMTLAWPAYTTIWQPILTNPAFRPERLPHLRHVLCVGPFETLQVMETALPSAKLVSCYGITEGSGIPSLCSIDDPPELRLGTAGHPLDGFEVQIRDRDTHVPLAPGERGALWLRGPGVIEGYWKDPVKTAESFDAAGWFNTGDLVSADADGRLSFHGRIKDTLKVGGENVAAVEVEAYLSTHPAVALAAVVGLPDAKYGEVPAAFVELRPDAAATEPDLIDFCRDGLAAFKVPRHVRFVTAWPMSATKIRKTDLREPLLCELGLEET